MFITKFIINFFFHLGEYITLMHKVFKKPEKVSIYWKQILREIEVLGLDSLGISIIISVFIGIVIAIQTATNIDNPLVPRYFIGYATKQSIILEFSPTINSASYLILPKIVASVLINQVLILISMFVGILGGWSLCFFGDLITSSDYIYGARYGFHTYYVVYSLLKTVVFAFIISSVSAYYGYYTKGGALEVGQSSTKAVVHSSIAILFFNLIITQLFLI